MKQSQTRLSRYIRQTALLVAAAASVSVTPAHAAWKNSFDSIQTIYQGGTPHTDKNGVFMLRYDPARSFFPLGIDHALEFEADGKQYSLRELKQAGYNTCFAWWGDDRLKTIKTAEEIGMQAVFWPPEEKDIEATKLLAKSPALLGYNLDDEPTGAVGNGIEERFAKLEEYKKRIRSVDSNRVITLTDAGWIVPPATAWWVKLNTWGDVSAHDNYPIDGANRSLSGLQGIPETVSLAAAINREQKPVWFETQNYEWPNPVFNKVFPTIAQQRCMVYTAIIHGATGIVHFAYDSFVTRQGNVVGIAPHPKAKYHAGSSATKAQLSQSRKLWHATAALNRQLTQLRPALLSPTATRLYTVEIDDAYKPVTYNPIRTLLKENPAGGYILLLSNVDNAEQHVRLKFGDKKFKTTELFKTPGPSDLNVKDTEIEFKTIAYGARIFQIDMQ